jgi:RNA polymerase sigma-B factor
VLDSAIGVGTLPGALLQTLVAQQAIARSYQRGCKWPPSDTVHLRVPFPSRPIVVRGSCMLQLVDSGPVASGDQAEPTARRPSEPDLVDGHLDLARSLARRFRNRGEPADDLDQVAFVALIKAARRFDPDRHIAFSTYATVNILGELKRHFRDKTWMLRVPRATQELYLSIKDARADLGHRLARTPTVSEIASHLGVAEVEVIDATLAGGTYWPASLDVYGPDGERSIDIPVIDACLDRAIEREQMRTLLRQCDPRERLILKRIYLDGETQQQVAEEIGSSQMQVSRVLARTLVKLRGRP